MKREVKLDELKRIQLEILDDVHAFCLTHGIRYSLCGGTLLGAVRHKGYIPWDDDIDIMMPRPDYERFIQSYASPQNKVLDLRNVSTTVELCVKVCREGTLMTDRLLGRTLWGINIDVFPIDGMPGDYGPHVREILSLRERLGQICPFYRVVARQKVLWFLKYCMKRILFFYPGNILSLKQKIDNLATRFDLESSPSGAAIFGSYGEREVIPATTFLAFDNIPFEGRTYRAISDYDTYLNSLYGDYMTLPPKEKQVTHHLYDVYID